MSVIAVLAAALPSCTSDNKSISSEAPGGAGVSPSGTGGAGVSTSGTAGAAVGFGGHGVTGGSTSAGGAPSGGRSSGGSGATTGVSGALQGAGGDGAASGGRAGAGGAPSGGRVLDGGTRDSGAVDPDAGIHVPPCTSGVYEDCSGLTCSDGQFLVMVTSVCGPLESVICRCVANPCKDGPIDCMGCAATVCASLDSKLAHRCSRLIGSLDGGIDCYGGGVCASPETRIATPNGDVPIRDLMEGDLVYSETSTGIDVVPLLAVVKRPVSNHQAVRVVFADGGELFVSGPHPTTDGRTLAELHAGDVIDGRRIAVAEYEPYPYPFTYDVLPASDTGAYVANGVWLGSTLVGRRTMDRR